MGRILTTPIFLPSFLPSWCFLVVVDGHRPCLHFSSSLSTPDPWPNIRRPACDQSRSLLARRDWRTYAAQQRRFLMAGHNFPLMPLIRLPELGNQCASFSDTDGGRRAGGRRAGGRRWPLRGRKVEAELLSIPNAVHLSLPSLSPRRPDSGIRWLCLVSPA